MGNFTTVAICMLYLFTVTAIKRITKYRIRLAPSNIGPMGCHVLWPTVCISSEPNGAIPSTPHLFPGRGKKRWRRWESRVPTTGSSRWSVDVSWWTTHDNVVNLSCRARAELQLAGRPHHRTAYLQQCVSQTLNSPSCV